MGIVCLFLLWAPDHLLVRLVLLMELLAVLLRDELDLAVVLRDVMGGHCGHSVFGLFLVSFVLGFDVFGLAFVCAFRLDIFTIFRVGIVWLTLILWFRRLLRLRGIQVEA